MESSKPESTELPSIERRKTLHDAGHGTYFPGPCKECLELGWTDAKGRYLPVITYDDAEVMRIWRECGLPEWFLGNGGTNHLLMGFANRLLSQGYSLGYQECMKEWQATR